MSRVTLKQLAAKAGVSVSAASHAINQTGNLSMARRKEILQVAEEIGYQRDPLLSAVAAQRFQSQRKAFRTAGVVTLVVGTSSKESRYSQMLPGLQKELHGFGIEVVFSKLIRSQRDLQQVVRNLHARGVGGLVIVAADEVDWLQHVDLSSFCVVGTSDLETSFPYSRVEIDAGYGVRLCFEKLYQAGNRRIAGSLQLSSIPSEHDRIRAGAYLSSLYSFKGTKGFPIQRVPQKEDDYQALARFVESRRIEALICFSPAEHYGLLRYGIKVPEEVQTAAAVINPHADAQVAGVAVSMDNLIVETARRLFNLMIHNQRGLQAFATVTRIRERWLEGGSIAKRER